MTAPQARMALFGTTEFVDQLQFGVTGSDNQFTAGF